MKNIDIDTLKNLIEKINNDTASQEEKDLVCNELAPQIKELNSLVENLLTEIDRARNPS